MKNLEPEAVWLSFLLRRLRLGLRTAKSPATANVLKELIAAAEERLDQVERAAESDIHLLKAAADPEQGNASVDARPDKR